MNIRYAAMDLETNELILRFRTAEDVQEAYSRLTHVSVTEEKAEIDREIVMLRNAGRVIDAIKYHRAKTGL